MNFLHVDDQYLSLFANIRDHGDFRVDRTGVGAYSLFGTRMEFDLADGLPLVTTKAIDIEKPISELRWFLSGNTSIKPLLLDNVHIWTEWPHKRYCDETGDQISLREFEQRVVSEAAFEAKWGTIGKGYGHQWRHWDHADGGHTDQITEVLKALKSNRSSRRILFTGWNVSELQNMALPPCHMTYQYFVEKDRLHCQMYQRSVDVGLGLIWNLFETALLQHMIAQQCDLEPGRMIWIGGDTHVYANHMEKINEIQVGREPRPQAHLSLTRANSLFDYVNSDFKVIGYDPHPSFKLPIAV